MPGGSLEEAVLNALWDLGRASTREVYDRVGEPEGLVYTTVAKVLDRLVVKGLVARTRHGHTFVYRAAVTRERMTRAQLSEVVARVIGPAPVPAMASLIDAVESVDPELLDELSRLIAQRRRSRHGS